MNIVKAIILIIIHVALYLIVSDGISILHKRFFVEQGTDINWMFTEIVAVGLFAIISVVITILYQLVSKNFRYYLLIVAFLIFGVFHIQNFTYRPYRTSLILLSGFIGLIVPFLIEQKLSNRNALKQ